MISTLTTFLRTSVNRGGAGFKGIKIFAFGSVLDSNAPNDIDLLIVFDPAAISLESIIEFRRQLCHQASDLFDLPFDICILTEEEASNNQFIEEERAVQILG